MVGKDNDIGIVVDRQHCSLWVITADVECYQDLSFDSPEGGDVVDGFSPGLKVFYQF
jgi:hypothetical protein